MHAILGNHEWWSDPVAQENWKGPPASRAVLETAGIPVYENDAVRLDERRAAVLAGGARRPDCLPAVAADASRAGPIGVDDLDGDAWRRCTDDAPVILLAHEPDIACGCRSGCR